MWKSVAWSEPNWFLFIGDTYNSRFSLKWEHYYLSVKKHILTLHFLANGRIIPFWSNPSESQMQTQEVSCFGQTKSFLKDKTSKGGWICCLGKMISKRHCILSRLQFIVALLATYLIIWCTEKYRIIASLATWTDTVWKFKKSICFTLRWQLFWMSTSWC